MNYVWYNFLLYIHETITFVHVHLFLLDRNVDIVFLLYNCNKERQLCYIALPFWFRASR